MKTKINDDNLISAKKELNDYIKEISNIQKRAVLILRSLESLKAKHGRFDKSIELASSINDDLISYHDNIKQLMGTCDSILMTKDLCEEYNQYEFENTFKNSQWFDFLKATKDKNETKQYNVVDESLGGVSVICATSLNEAVMSVIDELKNTGAIVNLDKEGNIVVVRSKQELNNTEETNNATPEEKEEKPIENSNPPQNNHEEKQEDNSGNKNKGGNKEENENTGTVNAKDGLKNGVNNIKTGVESKLKGTNEGESEPTPTTKQPDGTTQSTETNN